MNLCFVIERFALAGVCCFLRSRDCLTNQEAVNFVASRLGPETAGISALLLCNLSR